MDNNKETVPEIIIKDAKEITDTTDAKSEIKEQGAPKVATKSKKSKRNEKIIKFSAIMAIIIIIIILLFRGCFSGIPTSPVSSVPPSSSIAVDSNAQSGGRDEIDSGAIVDDLNKKVANSMINMSMNTNPQFENGKAKGNLLIINSEVNNYPQVVEIYLVDTEELIYKSGAIPVGSKIDSAALSVNLNKGEYECIAYFNNVNTNSGEYLGKGGANIKISILN